MVIVECYQIQIPDKKNNDSICTEFNALVNEKAQFCTECGKKIQTIIKMKD